MRRLAMSILLGWMLAGTVADAQPELNLSKVSQDWAHNWQAKDLDATLALYCDDAVFMDADGSRIAGKANLKKFFATVLAQYTTRPTLQSVRSEASGAIGYDWGDYDEVITSQAHPDSVIKSSGAYVVILRRVSGRWLIAAQTWTGNAPVPVKR